MKKNDLVISNFPYEFVTPPMEHQKEIFKIGMEKIRFLLALDMGLGKSYIAINLFNFHDAKKCLIVCPASVVEHWGNEISKHSRMSFQLLNGRSFDKRRQFQKSRKDFIIVSYPWINRQLSDKKISLDHFDFIILDEAHILGNPRNKIFWNLYQNIKHIKFRYLLTGTPIGNNWEHVWGLYLFLDNGKTFGNNYRNFLEKYFFDLNDLACKKLQKRLNYTSHEGEKRKLRRRIEILRRKPYTKYILKKNSSEEFKKLFWKRAISLKEEDCLSLPDKIFDMIPLRMSSAQRLLYENILNNIQEDNWKNQLVSLMKITGGIGDNQLSFEDNPKLKSLSELLDSLGDEKAIIWHWFVDEGRLISELLRKKYGKGAILELRGETSRNRGSILEKWKKGKAQYLIIQPRAGGIGIDLIESRVSITYSRGFSVIDTLQAEKRIHRIGQTKTVWYYDLIILDSIDKYVWESVRKGKDAFQTFMEVGNIKRVFEKGDDH